MAPEDTSGGRNERRGEEAPGELLSYLREHGFPKLETLNLTVFFGAHMTEGDAEVLLPHVKNADVFIPEIEGWTEKFEREIEEVAQGRRIPQAVGISPNFPYRPYLMKLLQGIGSTKKGVGFADIPAGSPHRLSAEDQSKILRFPQDMIARQWAREPARRLFVARMGKLAEFGSQREEYIVRHIGETIVRALRERADKGELRTLSVTVSLGQDHARMSDALRALHPEANIVLQEGAQGPRNLDALLARIRRNEEIPEDIADNALIETLLFSCLGSRFHAVFENTVDASEFLDRFTRVLSEEERAEFYALFITGDADRVGAYLEEALHRHRLSFGDFGAPKE